MSPLQLPCYTSLVWVVVGSAVVELKAMLWIVQGCIMVAVHAAEADIAMFGLVL